MKRLFEVGGVFFDSKGKAKLARGTSGAKIKLGPDHRRYDEKKAVGRTDSHNAKSGGPGTGFKKTKKGR